MHEKGEYRAMGAVDVDALDALRVAVSQVLTRGSFSNATCHAPLGRSICLQAQAFEKKMSDFLIKLPDAREVLESYVM
eukprot:6462924-Pyramimonas_sp.AAC.1